MVRASTYNGTIIISCLRKAQMLAHGKYSLSETDLLNILSNNIRRVAIRDFENSKEQFYEARPVASRTNGKFGEGPGSYASLTNILSIDMTPAGSIADVGKVITFFDTTTTPRRCFPGTIVAFTAGNPGQYQIVPIFNTPDLASIADVTVLDWLIGDANSIRILPPNEILSPENIVVFDVSNKKVIDIVDYAEFERRKKMDIYLNGKTWWGRYRKTAIDLASGSNAPPLGTVTISAYWVPFRSVSYGGYPCISETLVPSVEDLMVQELLSIKTGQPLPSSDVERKFQERQFEDRETREDQEKVR